MIQYPIYVISYHRPNAPTSRYFSSLHLPHFVCVHKDQIADYEKELNSKYATIIEFDDDYKRQYKTLDDIPYTVQNPGSGAERNFCWDDSVKNEFSRHWLFDDNIRAIYEAEWHGKKNKRTVVRDPDKLRSAFEFVEQTVHTHNNIGLIGWKYVGFNTERYTNKIFIKDTTALYSNFLIDNSLRQWEGRYNEDVILCRNCLHSLKAVVMLINFCVAKEPTREARGGNKVGVYDTQKGYHDSTLAKSELLVKNFSNEFKLVQRYGRVHHRYTGNVNVPIDI